MRRPALLLWAGLLLTGCHKPESTETAAPSKNVAVQAPIKVELSLVEVRKVPRYLTLTGSLVANRESQVAANVSGRIVATYVERGQVVKQGQPLAVVDSKAAGLSASAAAAQSKAAETQMSLAQSECDRADKLYAERVMTQAEHERMKAQCSAQLFSASAARANADLAAKLAGDTVIRSPIEGIVGERMVNVGEYVQPPSRVASVYAIDPVRVQISVPEPAVAMVKDDQTLELQVAAFPGRQFPARVEFVSPVLRAQTRDLIVEALASNTDKALRPGMFGTVLLQTGEEERPVVPVAAIREEGTTKSVFVAKDGQAQQVVVRAGISVDGQVVILDGVSSGDQVVLHPPQTLRDGSRIL